MIHIKENTCDFCGTCVGVCPENCIELLETDISVEHEACTDCAKCVWVCPVETLYQELKK